MRGTAWTYYMRVRPRHEMPQLAGDEGVVRALFRRSGQNNMWLFFINIIVHMFSALLSALKRVCLTRTVNHGIPIPKFGMPPPAGIALSVRQSKYLPWQKHAWRNKARSPPLAPCLLPPLTSVMLSLFWQHEVLGIIFSLILATLSC
jgi:hypothetical protein